MPSDKTLWKVSKELKVSSISKVYFKTDYLSQTKLIFFFSALPSGVLDFHMVGLLEEHI